MAGIPGLFEHKANRCVYFIVEDRSPSDAPSYPGSAPNLLAIQVFDPNPASVRSLVLRKVSIIDFVTFYGAVILEQTR